MKILLLHDYAARFGGAEALTIALRDGLRERGHDARLLATSAGLDGPSVADYECRGTTSSLRTALQVANPSAARAVRRAVAEFRPDVVHVRMFLTQLSPLVLPPLKDIPSIYHAVWYRAICPTGTKLRPDGAVCHDHPRRRRGGQELRQLASLRSLQDLGASQRTENHSDQHADLFRPGRGYVLLTRRYRTTRAASPTAYGR